MNVRTPEEITAQRETAWTLATLNDPAVRALLLVVERDAARMLWMLGWQQGVLTTRTEQLNEISQRSA